MVHFFHFSHRSFVRTGMLGNYLLVFISGAEYSFLNYFCFEYFSLSQFSAVEVRRYAG